MAVVETAVQAARMRGMALTVVRGSGSPAQVVYGNDSTGRPVTEYSLFPVASITKLATALAVLRLVDAGRISLDDPLARHVPEAIAAGHWGVTIRRLLSHISGLPLDVPTELAPYAPGLTWSALAEACFQTPLQREPAIRVQYSNVGYGLLAVAVERETEHSFADALQELVLRPLGIEGYLGVEPPRPPVHLSGVRGAHAKTELEPFNSAFWRSLGLPWAGLITTPSGAVSLVRAFAGYPEGFVRNAVLAEAVSNQNDNLGGGFVRPLIWKRCPWGLGVEVRDQKSPHWTSDAASDESFGHSGASGCVAWYDPARDIAWSIHGTRTADTGWLIRRGPEICSAILNPA